MTPYTSEALMFWIKENQGNLINLALASDVKVQPPDTDNGKYEVHAYTPGWNKDSYITLFIGTREECGQYRDNLYAHLREIQGGNRV